MTTVSDHPTTHEEEEELAPGTMSFWDHLDELRMRLIRALIGLVIAFLVSIIFTSDIIEYLAKPFTDQGGKLQNLEPTGNVVIYFRVALMTGAIAAIPYITYQLFLFVAPGLTDKERGWVLRAIPFTTAFFLLGVGFAWFVMLPTAFEFLVGFQDEVFINQWSAQRYFSFLTSILFWIGIAFEMPVFLFVLARLGLIGPRALINNWRLAVIVIAVLAALITPTVDPFNMMLVMGPLIFLYIFSILLVAFAERRVRQAIEQQQ